MARQSSSGKNLSATKPIQPIAEQAAPHTPNSSPIQHYESMARTQSYYPLIITDSISITETSLVSILMIVYYDYFKLELIHSPNLLAYSHGTAFPMSLAVVAMLPHLKTYFLGNVCSVAPSLKEIALSSSGCPKRPLEILKNLVVIVGAGLCHHMRP